MLHILYRFRDSMGPLHLELHWYLFLSLPPLPVLCLVLPQSATPPLVHKATNISQVSNQPLSHAFLYSTSLSIMYNYVQGCCAAGDRVQLEYLSINHGQFFATAQCSCCYHGSLTAGEETTPTIYDTSSYISEQTRITKTQYYKRISQPVHVSNNRFLQN